MDLNGAELSRSYFTEVVEPLVRGRWPGMPCAAARLGSGSDVLGLDDAMSRDHDWGLRLNLLVPAEAVADVDDHLAARLPDSFEGQPTRFATTWDPVVRHRVQVETARDLAVSRLGVDPTRDRSRRSWWRGSDGTRLGTGSRRVPSRPATPRSPSAWA